MKRDKDLASLSFNPTSSTVMHIDLNSCFASIEQQANPLLRGKPIAVAAYTTPSGCILAPSIEAKQYGVKTGMRVKDAKVLCPRLHVMSGDPDKYRYVHARLSELFELYTNNFVPKSIDEFVLDFAGYPILSMKSMHEVGKELKSRITNEVGDWLKVSIGIGPSRFIAKTASNLKKPDGLEEINKDNYLSIYERLKLVDLHGINVRNKARLNQVGIYTVKDFYYADLLWLKAAFRSVNAYYWYSRLRGWEIDGMEFSRKTFGNQCAMRSDGSLAHVLPVLQKLSEKTGSRMRRAGCKARGIHVAVRFADGDFWHEGKTTARQLFDSRDIYKEAARVLMNGPELKPVRLLAVNVFNLTKETSSQLELFDDVEKKKRIVASVDEINERWGSYTVSASRMISAKDKVPDTIGFGGRSFA